MPLDVKNLVYAGAAFGTALWASRRARGGGAVNPAHFRAALALSLRWAPVFPAVPPALALAVMREESSYRPDAPPNTNERASARGGAWGLMGMTGLTAQGLLPLVRARKDWPAWVHEGPLKAIAATGLPQALQNPLVNTLFGYFYLDRLVKEFGLADPTLVVAAYHSGPGLVRAAVRNRTPLVSALGPYGREYLAKVTAYRTELERTS